MQAASKQRHGQSWCGPTAMTVVTGLSYEECEQAIIEVSVWRDRVLGTYTYELHGALNRLGWERTTLRLPKRLPGRKRLTLGNVLGNVAWRRTLRRPVIINVTSHYVAFDPHTGKVFDQTSKDGVDWRKHYCRKRAVKAAWEFSK